jgi:hypothetical protein
VPLRHKLLPLLFYAFFSCNTHGQTVVATITVRVATNPLSSQGEQVPKVERINGKQFFELRKENNGQTFAIPEDTSIFLRFDATEFEVSPPGILEAPPGVFHLPRGLIGILHAVNIGRATITVKSARAAKYANGNPSGSSSSNWSGYALSGGPFWSISGEWTVPAVSSDGGGASSSWIGIDGASNNSLIQTGTEQDWNNGFVGIGSGPSYYAWWEVLPAAQTTIPHPVFAGDRMSARIDFGGSGPGGTGPPTPGSPMLFMIMLQNKTQNWGFNATVSYSGMLASAEWIEEATTQCNIFHCWVSLADYGAVSIDGLNRVNGGSPNFVASESINMMQGGVVISTPSNPDADVDGFSAAYGGSAPLPPGPSIVTTILSNAVLNQPYRTFLSGTDYGVPSGTLNWFGAGLPSWLSLSSSGVLSGTPPVSGVFPFSVTAVDPSNSFETATQALSLTVQATPPPPDFSLSLSPDNIALIPNGLQCSASSTVTVSPLNGFNARVHLTGDPSASFNPSDVSATGIATFTFNRCPSNIVTSTVTGTSGSLTHSAIVILQPPAGSPCPPPEKYCGSNAKGQPICVGQNQECP